MIRQPLRNCLKDYKGKLVKIGSERGISFFYCDKVSSKTENELLELSVKYLNQTKKLLKKSQTQYNDLDKIFDLKIKVAKEKAKTSEKLKKKLPTYIAKTNKRRENLRNLLPHRIMSYKTQIQEFKPFTERNVVKVYKGISVDELNCFIIMIRGSEKGKYWTVKEYQDKDKPVEKKRGLHDGIVR